MSTTLIIAGVIIGACLFLGSRKIDLSLFVDEVVKPEFISGPNIVVGQYELVFTNTGNVPVTVKSISAVLGTEKLSAVFYERLSTNSAGPHFDGATIYDIKIKPAEQYTLNAWIQINKATSGAGDIVNHNAPFTLPYTLYITIDAGGQEQVIEYPVNVPFSTINA